MRSELFIELMCEEIDKMSGDLDGKLIEAWNDGVCIGHEKQSIESFKYNVTKCSVYLELQEALAAIKEIQRVSISSV